MKKTVGSILAILAILFASDMAAAGTIDRILAKVNDEIITLSELRREMEPIRKEIMSKLSGPQQEQELKKAEDQILDNLIESALIYQKAVEMEYNAEAEERVDAYIQEVMKSNNLKDTDELENALAQEGKSLKSYKEYIERQMISQALVNDFINSRISLLTPEIERYYQNHQADFTTPGEVTLSEIVIDTAGGDAAAESRAAEVAGRIDAGESFATLAEQYSKGATAGKGGGIGSYIVEKLNPDTRKAIENVKEGGVSAPQKESAGLVIYRVDARTAAVVKPLDEVKDAIKDILYQEKRTPEYDRFITQLKEEAYIQIFPEMQ
ncbi:MAG: peptidyl-prolyl cis-trans isomerase [Acidobacteriota bacterium]|jgi:parvulin-like peptidyl-prolyl isomerase|nr:peptidyl-prolyl cis-trans isomerase [Acidobacteriota bacterium]